VAAERIWIDHDGGAMPVTPETTVMVCFRNGQISGPYPAGRWRWKSWPAPLQRVEFDIVKWCRP
jgi:hypothetical protein